MSDIPIEQTVEKTLPPAQPVLPPSGNIQVTQGNVPIVTVQLLNDISIKLSKILEKMNG
jgi:hypothetical protein